MSPKAVPTASQLPSGLASMSLALVGFGTLAVSKRKARTGRNPQTGAAIKIEARRLPRFTPGKQLKAGAFVAGTIGLPLAWLVERTDMPGKIWIYAGVPMTLAVPGMLQAIAWVILLSPRIGFINKTLQNAFNLSGPLIDIYSLGGMVFLE